MSAQQPPGSSFDLWGAPPPAAPDPDGLRGALAPRAGPLYAVVDGARHAGLAAALAGRGLRCRPLYLESDRASVQAKGPQLVPLPHVAAVEDALAVLGPFPQATFWVWRHNEASLFRHLRHLNLVEIPLEDPQPDGPRYETVLFRHWDPQVLAPILPILDADQAARVWGPAEALVLHARDHGELRIQPAPPYRAPDPSRRLIRFEPAQMARLAHNSRLRSIYAIATLVGELLEKHDRRFPFEFLLTHTEASIEFGKKIGLKSEAMLGLWCFLVISTKNHIIREKSVIDYIQNGEGSPDEMLEELVEQCLDLAKRNL